MNINEASHAVTMFQPTRRDNFAPVHHTISSTSRPSESSVALQPEKNVDSKDIFKENLQTAVGKIQEFVKAAASDLEFSIDEDSGRTVVKVVERESQKVIRQIPSQEMLDLAKALDTLQGLLIKQEA